MGQFLQSMFNPGAEAKKQATAQAEQNRLTLARQQAQQQQQEQETALSSSVISRTPRGRRLLMGDTAPAGASDTIGA